MQCPYCDHHESKVTDSRNAQETNAVRRRRECLGCKKRFTTFETVDLTVQVEKRDGTFQDFQIEKLTEGLAAASRHTRISSEQVRQVANEVAAELMEKQARVIESSAIGEIVMEKLRRLDTVAYIRFACVYRRFKELDELLDAIQTVASNQGT